MCIRDSPPVLDARGCTDLPGESDMQRYDLLILARRDALEIAVPAHQGPEVVDHRSNQPLGRDLGRFHVGAGGFTVSVPDRDHRALRLAVTDHNPQLQDRPRLGAPEFSRGDVDVPLEAAVQAAGRVLRGLPHVVGCELAVVPSREARQLLGLRLAEWSHPRDLPWAARLAPLMVNVPKPMPFEFGEFGRPSPMPFWRPARSIRFAISVSANWSASYSTRTSISHSSNIARLRRSTPRSSLRAHITLMRGSPSMRTSGVPSSL